MLAFVKIIIHLVADVVWFAILQFRPKRSLQVENLFLRRQLALFLALEVSTRPTEDPNRVTCTDSQDGAGESLWGEARIANELLVKLGIRVLPCTVHKYMAKHGQGNPVETSAGRRS